MRVYSSPIGNGLPHTVGRPQYFVLGGCRLPFTLLRWILRVTVCLTRSLLSKNFLHGGGNVTTQEVPRRRRPR